MGLTHCFHSWCTTPLISRISLRALLFLTGRCEGDDDLKCQEDFPCGHRGQMLWASGQAQRADFEGWEAQCSVNGPLGLSTMYCFREERLIHQELDLWDNLSVSSTFTWAGHLKQWGGCVVGWDHSKRVRFYRYDLFVFSSQLPGNHRSLFIIIHFVL